MGRIEPNRHSKAPKRIEERYLKKKGGPRPEQARLLSANTIFNIHFIYNESAPQYFKTSNDVHLCGVWDELVQMGTLTLRVPLSLRKAAEERAKLFGRTLTEELRDALTEYYRMGKPLILVFLASKLLSYASDALLLCSDCD